MLAGFDALHLRQTKRMNFAAKELNLSAKRHLFRDK